jgi:hypothetical protein
MPEFAFKKDIPPEYRAVRTNPEAIGIHTTGTADAHAAFHKPVEAELAPVSDPLCIEELEY